MDAASDSDYSTLCRSDYYVLNRSVPHTIMSHQKTERSNSRFAVLRIPTASQSVMAQAPAFSASCTKSSAHSWFAAVRAATGSPSRMQCLRFFRGIANSASRYNRSTACRLIAVNNSLASALQHKMR